MADFIFISSYWRNSRHWLLLFVLGILTSICGIWFCVQPGAAYATLSMVFGLSLFLGGFVLFALASANRTEKPAGWIGLIVAAAFSVLAGAFLIIHLGFTESILPYVFAGILFFQAMFNLFFSIHMYNKYKLWWTYFLNGVLLLIFSAIFAFYPFSSVIAMVFISAVMLIYWGVSMIFWAWEFRPEKS
jgi:uncharacterized membrane protein HdeD (DUF308 family)